MLASWIDNYLVPVGPCALCCGGDARHRVIDAIVSRVRAGEDVHAVALDYGVEDAFVERLWKEISST